MGVPRSAAAHGVFSYAISIFAGLILFNLFSELAYRAPMLLHEHTTFIKKSIFPSETLAWTATIRAIVYAAISFAVLLVFQLILTHWIPLTFLLLPFVLIPFFMFLLGVTWFLMALGLIYPRRHPSDGFHHTCVHVRDADFLLDQRCPEEPAAVLQA